MNQQYDVAGKKAIAIINCKDRLFLNHRSNGLTLFNFGKISSRVFCLSLGMRFYERFESLGRVSEKSNQDNWGTSNKVL